MTASTGRRSAALIAAALSLAPLAACTSPPNRWTWSPRSPTAGSTSSA
ncbi:hypothetical protein ACFQXA_22460 [Nocardiopsis composta]